MEPFSPSAPRPILPPPASLFSIDNENQASINGRFSSVLAPPTTSPSMAASRRSVGHASSPQTQLSYSNGRSASFSRPSYLHGDSPEARKLHVSSDSSHRASFDPSHLRSNDNDLSYADQSALQHLSRSGSISSSPSSLFPPLSQRASPEHPVLPRPRISSLSLDKSSQMNDGSFSRRYSQAPIQQSESRNHLQGQSSGYPAQVSHASSQNFGSWKPSFNQPIHHPATEPRMRSEAPTTSMRPPMFSPNNVLSPGSSHPHGNSASDYFANAAASSTSSSGSGQAASLSPIARAPPLPQVQDSNYPVRTQSISKQEGRPDFNSEGQELHLRKRLRISRACNECRRRKTKCNIIGAFPGEAAFEKASSELKGESVHNDWGMIILQPCTNCKRSDIKCAYTKRSVKRVPAKGYIKELEKRLDHLENVAMSPAAGSSTPVSKSSSSNPDPEATEDRIARLETVLTTTTEKESNGGSNQEMAEDDGKQLFSRSSRPSPSVTNFSNLLNSSESAVSNESSHTSFERSSVKRGREETNSSDIFMEDHSRSNVGMPFHPRSRNPSTTSHSSQRLKAIESASHIKSSYLSTSIQATFPVIYFDPLEAARSLIGLDERPLLRGMKLVLDPIEKPASSTTSINHFDGRSRSVSRSGSPFIFNGTGGISSPAGTSGNGIKAKSHSSKQINLFAQASRGFSTESNSSNFPSFASNSKKETPPTGAIRAGRRLSQMKSALEADTLLFCYLDSLRRGEENHAPMAVAVSKLGGLRLAGDDEEPATRRRRTVMMMMDRWHSLAFNTAPLLFGRLALEDQPLSTLITSLGSTEGSMLGDGVIEILRAARMFSQLRDLVDNYGWKAVNETELIAIFERNNDDSNQNGAPQSSLYSFPTTETEVDDTSNSAFRISFTSGLRTYHHLNVLSTSTNSSFKEMSRLCDLAESIVVLGTTKRGISQNSILLKTLVGPHILSIAIVSFCLILRSLTLFVKRLEFHSEESNETLDEKKLKGELQKLEHFRRKTNDYLGLIAMLLPLCGEENLSSQGSYQPLSIKLSLFCHSNLNYSNSLGDLVKSQSSSQSPNLKNQDPSPLNQSYPELLKEYDDFLELIRDCGPLGLILSSIEDDAIWNSSQNLQYEGVGFEDLA